MKQYQKIILGLAAIVGSYQMNAQKRSETRNYKHADEVNISYADINGDGYVDKLLNVRIRGPPTKIQTYAYLNDKEGSFLKKIYTVNSVKNYKHADEVNISYADMNKDGFTDQIVDVRIRGPPTKIQTFTYLNDKKGNFLKKWN